MPIKIDSLRIALFHNLPSGGAKRAVYEWTRRLSKTHDIDVYTLSTADHEFCDIRPYVNHHYIYDFKPNKLLKSPFGRLNQFQRWRDLKELSEIGQKIAKKMNSGSYGLLFANPCQYTFIPTCLHYIEIPSIYYLHEPFGLQFVRNIQRPYLKDNGGKHQYRIWLNRADPFLASYRRSLNVEQINSLKHTQLLLANSRFTRETIKTIFGRDSHVCNYGVNSNDFYKIQGITKDNSVISVGEMTPRKGFDFLVESIGRIPHVNRPILTLVCNWDNQKEKQYIHSLATKNNVTLKILTSLNTEQLAREYNKARVCVYAPVMEPFGLVPLEAMACGVPVIGVAEGGVMETVVDGLNGRLVERDPETFAQAVLQLLESPNLLSKYGQQAREYVIENWSWDKSIQCLESYLIEAVNKS